MTFKRYPTAAERRRELAEDEADRLAHERPNIPPWDDRTFDACTESKYQTHQFSAIGADRVVRCAFCGRTFHACLKVT